LLHESSRLNDDSRIKRIAEDKMRIYIKSIPSASLKDCQVIVQAVEHMFLCRHIILNICVMGQFLKHFNLGGGKVLKSEAQNLQNNINLLSSVIDVPVKEIDIATIEKFTRAVRTGIKSFQLKLASVRKVTK